MTGKIQLPRKPQYQALSFQESFSELFRRIEAKYDTAFLLESLGDETYDSRYSVTGFSPRHIFRAVQDKLYLDDKEIPTSNPYLTLREYIPQDVLSRHYAGGLVGYLGYDASNYFESALQLSWHPDFPAFEFGFYDDGIIYDKMTGDKTYFYYDRNRLSDIQALLAEPMPAEPAVTVRYLGDSRNREEHKSMVSEALEEILSGNTFQCQIGFTRNYEIHGNPLALYQNLRKVNPSPHMYYVKSGKRVILGSSPELLFRLRSGEMETYPLAGTIHRGETHAEDLALARKLLNDPKEIAEHNMLIDLHRNDIGRVARFGTVKVRRAFDLKKFSHVQHISSEVVGIIDPRFDMFDGVLSSFPAGTLSGAPKIESMKIIERIEKSPRGPYGGAIGHFGVNGDSTFAIPIRTLFIHGNKAFSRASGGVVYNSTPDGEYNEIQNKMAAVTRAIAPFLEDVP